MYGMFTRWQVTKEDASDVEVRRAVKTLKPNMSDKLMEAFILEAKVQTKLKHRNIVEIVGVCTTAQPFLVVLDYCMYGDLLKMVRELNDKGIEMSRSEHVHILRQIADALGYIAGNRVVHMDVAARNILVHKQSTMKLADFGLANAYTEGEDHFKLKTRSKLPFLTVPPESFPVYMWDTTTDTYQPNFGEKTDVWAFGCLMYEMFTSGDVLYGRGADLMATMEQVSVVKHALSYILLPVGPPRGCLWLLCSLECSDGIVAVRDVARWSVCSHTEHFYVAHIEVSFHCYSTQVYNGMRLQAPVKSDVELKRVMSMCFADEAERPRFKDIIGELDKLSVSIRRTDVRCDCLCCWRLDTSACVFLMGRYLLIYRRVPWQICRHWKT